MLNIAVLVSGGGTNFQALIDAAKFDALGGGKPALCISSNPKAYALERARENNIPSLVIRPRDYAGKDEYAQALLDALEAAKTDVVVLAGYLEILPAAVVARYENRVVNVHPSLIPSFCGKGFYGLRVHEAVLARGVKVTGATVHMVTEEVDAGKILMQRAVEVKDDDTPETLQKRVMKQAEWIILPAAVARLCRAIAMEKEKQK